MDDRRLLERARQGDEAAFVDLFARYQTQVFRYAAQMCGPTAADDIVQEAFLALLRQLDRYDPSRGTLIGYLLGIARHHVFRRLAESRSESLLDDRGVDRPATDQAAAGNVGNPFDALSRSETIDRVRTAIRSLPPAFREVVVLCELNELDYATAAAVVGCPIGTVRSRLHRARTLLMKLLATTSGRTDDKWTTNLVS